MANILINQQAGLGDIIFCQKIAKKIVEQGNQVYWPVLPQLSYVNDYLGYAGIAYSEPNESLPVIDLCNADRIYGGCVIRAKYSLAGYDYADWSDWVTIKRNHSRENELFELLGCGEKYAFVNRNYGTVPNMAVKNFSFDTKLKVIESRVIDGFNPFDWCKVYENASEIYTVDTSIMVIMEKLKLKSESNNVWGRLGHFTHVEGLFKTNWNYRY